MASLKQQLKARPSVSDKWREVKSMMQTHLMGRPPEWLFRSRRPLESTNAFALEYRLENFQPITKQPFNVAVAGVIETADHVYTSVTGLEDETADFLEDYTIKVAGKTYDVKDYVVHHITRMVEIDPNAVLVVLPLHPEQDIIYDFREDLPDFNTVPNEPVRLKIKLVGSDKIWNVDDTELVFEGGDWLYKVDKDQEHYAPFYWVLTAEETGLYIPYAHKNTYEYRYQPWYANDLMEVPFDTIGNNPVIEEIDDEYVTYHESTFSGAVSIANTMLGIASDADICMTRFTYPEKFASYEPCRHPASVTYSGTDPKWIGKHVVYNGTDCSACPQCDGLGTIKPDTSPLGTHIIAKSDLWTDDGRFIPPLQFITPPLESPQFLADQVERYYQKMEEALFITRQNMTNQSGESKSYDVKQKITIISGAVKNVYGILEKLLGTIQGYLVPGTDEVVRVQLPPDFQIKTSEDITWELGQSRNTSSVYTSELTRELLLKKFGNDEVNRRIVDFLEVRDKHWGKTVEEIVKMKAIYGTDITARDQVIHDKGFPVMKEIAKRDDFLTMSEDALMVAFNAAIDKILGLEPEREEISDDPLLQLEAEAKSKLKGTVGGVQGIIQINAAVAAGQMTEDAAQALLQEIYGFTPEIADRLIEPVQNNTGTAPANLSPIA